MIPFGFGLGLGQLSVIKTTNSQLHNICPNALSHAFVFFCHSRIIEILVSILCNYLIFRKKMFGVIMAVTQQ